MLGDVVQGNRVASPVPAFDCSSQSWARPTLERAEVPFIRGSQGTGPLDFAAEWGGMLSRSGRLGPAGLLSSEGPPSGRRGVMTTVTDEDLLSHLTTDVFAEQQQFVKARSTASPDKRGGPWAARDAGGGGGGGGGEAETVLRTDHAGRVVEVCPPGHHQPFALLTLLVDGARRRFAVRCAASRRVSMLRRVSVSPLRRILGVSGRCQFFGVDGVALTCRRAAGSSAAGRSGPAVIG
jgi:hypothetical protein